jgi:subtilase family serine protease
VHLFSTVDVPQVNSISYGWWEGDQCTIDPTGCQQLGVDSTGYTEAVNVQFQKIALRGISLLSASGDSGANGRTDPDCSDPHLRPSFPGSSPYITAVGATELVSTTYIANPPPICAAAALTCAQSGTEQAVSYAISSFASGGGFSDIAAMPSYQTTAVNAYLNSGVVLPGAGYFNASGRAFPDIAAVGHNVIIIDGGAAQPVGGTSASSPIVASIMALLNTAQIEITGKPLGFLNPFLYQMYAAEPTAFNDITVGDNKCTEQGCAATCEGYLCAPGWDPVTGLGTPNFAKMLAYVKSGKHMAHKRK